MINLVKTDSSNPDFVSLVRLLDADLSVRDGEEHAFYAQFNKIDAIKYVILAYDDKRPVGCGAFKILDKKTVEIKRMFTLADSRGQGVARLLLAGLEEWAAAEGFSIARLETGTRQPEAIALYTNTGYSRIPNYGQYAGVENSLCFEKEIS